MSDRLYLPADDMRPTLVLTGEYVMQLVPPIEIVTEGVYFAWRNERGRNPLWTEREQIRNGVWWNATGTKVISLATGDILHIGEGPHFETYAFKPAESEGGPSDVCNHHSFAEAEACALHAMRTGRWCYSD